MVTKLTLTMEKEVIIKAKAYAKESGRSLSSILENYLKGLTSGYTNGDEEKPEWMLNENSATYKLWRLSKEVQASSKEDYKKQKQDRLIKKYLSND